MDRFLVRKKPESPFLPDPQEVPDPTEARATVDANTAIETAKELTHGKYGVFSPEFRATMLSTTTGRLLCDSGCNVATDASEFQ